MKKTIALILVLTAAVSYGQEMKRCGTTEAMQAVFAKDPAAKARFEQQEKELEAADAKAYAEGYQNYPDGYFSNANNVAKNNSNGHNSTQATVYTIPVVFHVLHANGPEKITPEQIQDAMYILNRDYNKQNADTADVLAEFQGIIGKVEFNFVLATKDPNGNCTNGIIYHYDTTLTHWTSGASTPFTGTSSGKWNPTKYLNVYTVSTITGNAAGYTYNPGTWSTGDSHDCVIILHDYVGSIGTSQTLHSRALTHEVGHWFNLQHVWGPNNQPGTACGNDQVSDTPITKGWDHCPPGATASQVCNAGVTENYQNYMDYSYCSVMFTAGQVTRMRTSATSATSGRNNIWSATNLNNTGVTSPMTCVPNPGFLVVYNKRIICAGTSTQFQDSTWNTTVTGWNWSFPGGTPATSTDSMPVVVYNTPGVYSVSYTASTTAGSASVTGNNIIQVGAGTATVQSNFTESFESITVPNSDWTIDNPSGSVMWQQTNTAGSTGSNSMMINNFTNPASSVETLYTPSFNLAGINTTPTAAFTFKLAYQRKTTSASEKLQVFASTNCGATWVQRYSKNGSSLATVTGANTSAFTPSSAADWRTETVNIGALLASSNVWFKFVFTSDASGNSNNIYIDDINIASNAVGLDNDPAAQYNLLVYPNPSNGLVNIAFELAGKHQVKLELVDMLGRTIETAVTAELQGGAHEYSFGGNKKPAAGVYFSRLTIDGKAVTQKVIID